jgi:hypothetical protein
MSTQDHSNPLLVGVEEAQESILAGAVPKDVKATAVCVDKPRSNMHVDHILCGIVSLDLLFSPLQHS